MPRSKAFRGDENIASKGTARQSITYRQWNAELAIDGNTNGRGWGSGVSLSVTATGLEDASPWWEVDLGAETPIDRVEVWNRADRNFGSWLYNFKVKLLVADLKTDWEKGCDDSPAPKLEIDLSKPAGLPDW